ncbi:MAG: ABC transporter permease, partial [Gemmatimonadota bacterium]
MLNDIRHAIRSLRKSPGFTLISVLTLALGIGATATIFALLDAIVLNPLKYPDPDRLAWVESSVPGVGEGVRWGVSRAGYLAFDQDLRTISSIGAYSTGDLALAYGDKAEGVRAASVTHQILPMLGARAALGRLIEEQDTRVGAEPVVVL